MVYFLVLFICFAVWVGQAGREGSWMDGVDVLLEGWRLIGKIVLAVKIMVMLVTTQRRPVRRNIHMLSTHWAVRLPCCAAMSCMLPALSEITLPWCMIIGSKSILRWLTMGRNTMAMELDAVCQKQEQVIGW